MYGYFDSINRLGSGRMKDANQFTKEFIQATTGANFRGGNVGNLAVDGLIDLATGATQDSANLNKVYKSMLDLGSNKYISEHPFGKILTKRKVIDEPLKILLGPVTNPQQRWNNTIRKMSAIVAEHDFLTTIKEIANSKYGLNLFPSTKILSKPFQVVELL